MSNSSWENFGSLLGDMAVYSFVYLCILFAAVIVMAVLIISYIQKRSQKDEAVSKKLALHRIFIYILSGILLLITIPLVFTF